MSETAAVATAPVAAPQNGAATKPAAVTSQASTAANDNAAAAPPPTKHKVKVNGKETEITTEEALKRYELSEHSYRRMEQAAAKEKAATEREAKIQAREALFARAEQGDPEALRQIYGPKWRSIVEEEVLRIAEEANMRPEERDRRRVDAERKKLDAERAEWEKQQTEQRIAKQQEAYRSKLVSEIVGSLKEKGLSPTPHRVARFAAILQERVTAGQEVDLAAIADDMIGEYSGDVAETIVRDLDGLDGEPLIERVEQRLPGLVERIRNALLAKARATKAQLRQQQRTTANDNAVRQGAPPERVDLDGLRRKMGL